MIGMIKETRFTVIPKHHHVDMELNYIYSGSAPLSSMAEKLL